MGRKIRLTMLDASSESLSLHKQLNILGIAKSSYYYTRNRIGRDKNCYIKEDVLSIFKRSPTYGYRRISEILRREYG